jgi:hypothetical protein
MIISGLGLAVGFSSISAWAETPKEVIATNRPAAVAKPTLPPVAVAPVSYTVRGQNSDNPTNTPTPSAAPQTQINTDTGSLPLHAPLPSAPLPSFTTPIPGPAPAPSAPCNNCGPTAVPFDPALAPLPGGVFNFASAGGPLPYRWYASAEYLYWWIRDGGLPPLVTTGSPNDPVPGVLDPVLGPTTQVLYGNGSLDTQGRSGARFEFGRWFGACTPWAIEGGFFFLGQRTASYTAGGDGSPGSPVIGRPFFENNRQVESIEYVNFPGIARGTINITSTNNFYGAHVDWRRRLWCPNPCQTKCGGAWRIDGQIGFRYLNLDEDLNISENPQLLVTVVNEAGQLLPAGLQQNSFEYFRVNNDFYGAMLGLTTEWSRGRWSLGLNTRVSLGTTHRQLEIDGGQTITVPGAQTGQFVGGLLARQSNIGTYTDNTFTVVPEVNFNVGYQFTNHFKMFLGYNFIYWPNVWRVGDQVDRNVNLESLPLSIQPGQTSIFTGQVIPPGTARPTPGLIDTDFWAQGINVGMLFTW